MITYIRMESKLVHGQTCTVLQKHYKCDGIICVDNKVAVNEDLKSVFKLAAPIGVKVYFFNEDKGIEQITKAETSEKNYFVIFRDPITVKNLLEKGYVFKNRITCGQQFTSDTTINVMQGCGLTPETIDALRYIETTGTEVVFDPSCKLENVPWSEIKKRI